MSCCNRSTSNSAIDQAVQDALASRMNELAGYSSSAANSAAAAAAALEASQDVQNAIAIIKAQVQSILDSANDLVPDISNTTGILQETYEALLNVNDALAGLLVVNYYYTVVGGESTILIPDTYNTSSIRALYIEGVRQDPGYGFVYDNVTKLITLAEPFPTEAAGTVVLVQVGVEDVDTPETLAGQIASATGAGMVGTSNNSTVQHELDLKAPLESPAFSGTPTVPTAAADTNNTQSANTAFVVAALSNAISTIIGNASAGADTLGELETLISNKAAKGSNSDITRLTGLTGVSPLPGVTDASEAAVGKVGEVITAAQTNGVALATSTTLYNIVSITLTPGDWDVSAGAQIQTTAGATVAAAGISLVSASFDSLNHLCGGAFTINAGTVRIPPATRRINVSVNTTVYLVEQANFPSGTATGYGFLLARRRR